MDSEAFEHWCEVCGQTAILTSNGAFAAGWDFPPRMGAWGVISPRTCGSCPITATVWWAVVVDGLTMDMLSAVQRRVLGRILSDVPGDR